LPSHSSSLSVPTVVCQMLWRVRRIGIQGASDYTTLPGFERKVQGERRQHYNRQQNIAKPGMSQGKTT
jgi:hypothetical protein